MTTLRKAMPMPANGFSVTLDYGNGEVAKAMCKTYTTMRQIERTWLDLQVQADDGHKWTITCDAHPRPRPS